ncbi:hypothetical protein ASE80_15185 [Pseudomonas sp. Leaf15]|uniref:hypothetical protein n=1 Tax=unclassified Pseudomonas TaxID=196821 RepID=UPI000703AE52|nr:MULTISPECIES: hypothetical protein [unclassified Pseudomonas]KQM46827.1 hypothetical protein ASE80_15185 [Pseudomonas sp. Leaf15]RAH02426.1 hypothetical protein DJ480_11845 [Pseudomonas sp. Leaf98]
MSKFWIIPAVAVAAIVAGIIYTSTATQSPVASKKTVFADGTTISDLRFDSTDSLDKHKLAVMKVARGKESGLSFAVHLNDDKQAIAENVGDFELAKFCTGTDVLTCSIPLSLSGFEHSKSLGVVAYSTPGVQLVVKEGRSDWDGHRAIFPTN